jgi:GNAT superfamily N-acetyltransferase
MAAADGASHHGSVDQRFSVITDGARYLELATTLLQRMRLAAADGGIWEAADVQWWHREERATDHAGQLFWLDDQGEPLAACIGTDFEHSGAERCDVIPKGSAVPFDVLVLPDDPGLERAAWRTAISRADDLGVRAEFTVRLDNATAIAELAAAGYSVADEAGVVTCWLQAAGRPRIPQLAAGYRLLSRADAPDRPHPMIARNGPDVESRLRQCSLYRPDLDLFVEAPDGQVAGYGLFWPDPVTGVGLIEPIRTEDAHAGQGIASHLIAVGLDRLCAQGCARLKVCSDRDLYQRAGFRPMPAATAAIYTR